MTVGRMQGLYTEGYAASMEDNPEELCDMGEDETIDHEILEYEKYDSDGIEMMCVILTDMGCGLWSDCEDCQ